MIKTIAEWFLIANVLFWLAVVVAVSIALLYPLGILGLGVALFAAAIVFAVFVVIAKGK